MTTPDPPAPGRVFWHNVDPDRGDRFYADRRDGVGVGVWEQRAEPLESYPADVKMVRIIRPGEPTIEQLKAQHEQEKEVVREMAGAHERAVVSGRVRDAELRASMAEADAERALAAKMAKADAAARAAENERRAWVGTLDRFVALADRIGEIWGEGEVGTEEATAWRDPEDGERTRHFTSVAIDRVLERLEGIVAGEHPSVTYPAPSDATVDRGARVLRAQLGHGAEIRGAVQAVLADAAKQARTA